MPLFQAQILHILDNYTLHIYFSYLLLLLQDRRTDLTARQVPAIDAKQDWIMVNGSQADGFTTLEFSRLLDTGDTAGDRIIGEVN